MPLAAGTRLGPYQTLGPIGAGGMGEVYRAHDPRMGRDVAVKISAERFSNRFSHEVRAVAALNHPNICQLYDVGPNYLVMELVEGPTLAERIKQGPVPLEEALAIAKQLAEAMEAAHEKGIIHRDLKPGNIKLRPDGAVKVLDFGLAKVNPNSEPSPDREGANDPDNSPTLTIEAATRLGTILGTAPYMSPEQACGKPVDKRADIWSFGAVLYEVLTGKRAFQGESASDILAAVLKLEPDWSALPTGTPPGIQRLLRRCLQRERKQRLHDIADARLELEEAPDSAPAPPPSRRRSWLPWAVTGVLAATLLTFEFQREAPPLRPTSRWTMALPSSDVVDVELSHDGTRLVYGSASNAGLILRALDRPESKRLTGAVGVGPVFSPDGQWIVYFAGDKLQKVPASGGAAITICEAPSQRGRTWGDDNTIVYGTADGGLMRVPAAGGAPRALTTPDRQKGEASHEWPYFLPGARAIVFTITTGGSYETANIAALDLERGTYHTVVHGGSNGRYVPTGHLVYVRSGTLFAAPFDSKRLIVTGPEAPVIDDLFYGGAAGFARYSFADSGLLVYLGGSQTMLRDRRVDWIDRHGAPQPSNLPPRLYLGVRLSPDGHRVAATIGGSGSDRLGASDVWIGELDRGTLIRLTSEGAYFSPAWTPDGKQVAFGLARAGRRVMYQAAADGSAKPEPLLESGSYSLLPMSWTPDGDLIYFNSAMRQLSLFTPRASGEERRPRILMAGGARDAKLSPDGRWIAYDSNESGRFEIYLRSFPSVASKRVVSTMSGETPRWSRSGRELFFRDPVKNQLMVADIQTSPEMRVGHPRALFTLPPRARADYLEGEQSWDVAPDGSRFLVVTVPDERETGVKLQSVVNWFDELRRRVSGGSK